MYLCYNRNTNLNHDEMSLYIPLSLKLFIVTNVDKSMKKLELTGGNTDHFKKIFFYKPY